MAINYLSKPYGSDPYTLPFDLNLFAKVMTYKQQKYDQGAQKIQGEIDAMGAIDVVKDQDRAYLNGKIKSLVDGVNNLGGVNLSDNNIVNQIEGFGSDIYSDDKVLTAISGTKAVRQVQAGYRDMKTNPKLSKLYSPVNEAYDNRAIQSWMQDGQVGSSYNGPSSASPYTPYRENHLKEFQKLTANMREKITDKGLVYVTEKNEEITPERVMQMAGDLLTPEEGLQMKKDAWYLYKDQDPKLVVQKSLDLNNQKIERAQQLLDNYKANVDAATDDPVARQNYINLANRQQQEVNDLVKGSKEIANNGLKRFQQDPESYMYETYKGDYFRGLGERFAYSKNTVDVKANQAQMFADRQKQTHEQFEENLKFQKDKLETESELKAAELGWKMFKDPLTGKMKTVQTGGLTVPNVNTADISTYKVTEQTFKNQNAELMKEQHDLFTNFVRNAAAHDPNLAKMVSSGQTGTGFDYEIKGERDLPNSQKGLGFESFNIDWNSPSSKRAIQKYGYTPEQETFLKNIYNNYKDMADGKPVDINKLPKGFSDLVEKYQLLNEKIKANEAKMDSVNRTASEHVGLTDADMEFYNEYAKEKKQADLERYVVIEYGSPAYSGTENYNFLDKNKDRFDSIKEKGQAAETYKDTLYEQVENRPVFDQKILTDDKTKTLAKTFSEILNNIGDVNGKLKGQSFPIKDITVLSAGKSADGTDSYEMAANVEGEKGAASTISVKLTGQQAKELGFTTDPYSSLNDAVNLTGRSSDLFISGGKKLVTRINVVRSSTDRNDQSSYVQILIPTGDPKQPYNYVDLPEVEGATPSEAYAAAKELIQNYERLGGNLTQLHQEILDKLYK